jgi:hypothetical protein
LALPEEPAVHHSRSFLLCLILVAIATGCHDKSKDKVRKPINTGLSADPVQAEAEMLGRDLFEMVDLVMSFRSAHDFRLPATLSEAGIDTLTPLFVRRLSRQGFDPKVTILFRKPQGRTLLSCEGTNRVLEESVVNGDFEVSCAVGSGGSRTFTVSRFPPKPEKDE